MEAPCLENQWISFASPCVESVVCNLWALRKVPSPRHSELSTWKPGLLHPLILQLHFEMVLAEHVLAPNKTPIRAQKAFNQWTNSQCLGGSASGTPSFQSFQSVNRKFHKPGHQSHLTGQAPVSLLGAHTSLPWSLPNSIHQNVRFPNNHGSGHLGPSLYIQEMKRAL